MALDHAQPFSNPIAPPDHDSRGGGSLTNDDFRRLLATPRAGPSAAPAESVTDNLVKRQEQKKRRKFSVSGSGEPKISPWLAKLRKEEEERQAEWAKKYRDRAKERREDGQSQVDDHTTSSGYRAVAPNVDLKVVSQRRKQTIEESKFLGGDMEHTHLVKGLDYALLHKVRGEISFREREREELRLLEKRREREREKSKGAATSHETGAEEDVTFRTRIAKNVVRAVFHSTRSERNEYFFPGRMAYVFELDDEYAESDIPTTLMRSKTDCPLATVQTTLSTNDIVINKLTQILSYLRQGRSSKKGKKKDKGKIPSMPEPAIQKHAPSVASAPAPGGSIYEDIGEYVFDPKASNGDSKLSSGKAAYFESSAFEIKQESQEDIRRGAKEFVKAVNEKFTAKAKDIPIMTEEKLPPGWSADETVKGVAKSGVPEKVAVGSTTGFGGFSTEEHYAECYPGAMEEVDATLNSDDEADYMKMDMGNHKGPVRRWDFDNEDDYSTYQSAREAMPKAAFQYGVKMSDGRKTRRQGAKNDKAKLNREWQQISQILQKRKVKELDTVSKRLKTSE